MTAVSAVNGTEVDLIAAFKLKRLLKTLAAFEGSDGTSLITLLIPPRPSAMSHATRLLTEESGTSERIKSRVTRQSVQAALASAQSRLRAITKLPETGLALFCGIVDDKRIVMAIEPPKPLTHFSYLCDSRFHTEELETMLREDSVYGFVVIDGQGALFATLSGSTRNIIQRLSVDLPNKHGRGGQSSVRFARLRLERRAAYILKVAELCTQHFITGDRPNIKGLILAGSADLKNELHTSDHLDPRLCSLVLKVVDTAYGGDNGLQEAIAQSADAISAAHILLERSALQEFFEHVARDSGRYAFGHVDTLAALSAGAVERLLVHEELGTVRYELSFPDGSSTVVCQDVESAFEDGGATIVSAVPLVEWLAENYSRYGATLTLISGNSPEGQQFVRGFGGVGAILRWALSLAPMEEVITEDE